MNSALSARFRTEQPNKRPKKGGDKSAVATVKSVRQLGCVSQDAEPPESVTISRKGTKVLGPIRRVRFTRAALREANIRESKGPSLKKIQVKSSHQRSPYAVKFEDRSQEETERQERCARGDAWKIAKNIYKLKETEKATFYSPSDECGFCQPHPQQSRRKESLWWILEQAKHRTEWCAEADRYRCMRCGRGSKYMKMPGRCTGPKSCQKFWKVGKTPSGRS